MTKFMRYRFAVALLVIVAVLNSCQDEQLDQSKVVVTQKPSKATITPYSFNWEPPTDYMPTPSGVYVRVPWSSFSNQGFSQDIRYDYKASDGWYLVYNTFSPTYVDNPKSFVLYNKYRGILRYYLYVDAYNAPAPSDYIWHNLKLESANGSTNSMLNFSGQDLIDVTQKKLQTSEVIPYKVSSTSGWYAFQYELAYDPTITSQTYQNINLRWSAGTTSVTQANLSGSINGTIKGQIGTPSDPPGLFAQAAQGIVTLTGLGILSNNPTLLPTKIQSAATEAMNSGFQGVMKNLFSAVFGGNSNNVQQVDLKINTTVTLNGTLTTPAGLIDNVFTIPGVSNSQVVPGYAPLYNTPLGVFNLSAVPNIKYTATRTTAPPNGDGPANRFYRYDLSVNNNSFQIVFNPAVTSSATISNITKEIVLLDRSLYYYGHDGSNETVGQRDVATGVTYVSDYADNKPSSPYFALRIRFDVTPNNGAPKSTIVKTFKVNVTL